jgi:peroxiredoxin
VASFLVLLAVSRSAPAWQAPAQVAGPQAPKPQTPDPTDQTALPPAGHSIHGEAFNEGPRQKAYLMGGTGNVHLEITTKVPQVQKFFDQGVGQLHGFWTYEAERSFRQAAMLDPDCAMAYWGMAMANFTNTKRAKEFINKAVDKKSTAGRREQLWIDGLSEYQNSTKEGKERWQDYIKSLERILYEFPDELEARAFLCWAMWSARNSGVNYGSHFALDALIGEVLNKNPLHPAHHYRIHLWDYEKPALALASSALCGESAPMVAHMWHMPGHIYFRVQRYEDAAWQQEASARVDHAQMVRDQVMPHRIHNYAHNNEWLCRTLVFVGRVHDCVDLAKNLIELPQHPQANHLKNQGSAAFFGRLRLIEVLTRYELWDQAIKLCQSPYLAPTDHPEEQVKRLRLLGAAYFGKSDLANGKAQITALEEMLAVAKRQQDADGEAAEKKAREESKPDADVVKAKEEARRGKANQIRQLEEALEDLRGRLAMAEGRYDEGLELLNKANGVLKEQLALFHLQAGKHDKAEELARQARQSSPKQVQPLANYVDVLYRIGKKDEAFKAFGELRQLSSCLDLDVPVFERLAPVAAELKLPEDWRQPREIPADFGPRPDLAALGPFRWHPAPAPQWSLPDEQNQTCTLQQHQGKPVVLIFFLGYGCLHCVQQLEKFAPQTPKFQEAGLDLVAISTDNVANLHKAVENYKGDDGQPKPFPFPLVADPELKVFRDYRCYDDFENKPLHGTFVISPSGKIIWQDISYEPFMDLEFLLQEARRLLGQEQ